MLGFKDFNNKLLIKLISSLNNQITLGYNFKKKSQFLSLLFFCIGINPYICFQNMKTR